MTTASEILVVDPTAEWATRLRVLATAPPRVVVFEVDPGDLDEVVAAHGRLAIVRNSDGTTEMHGDPSVVDELDDSARLFVEAWRESRSAKPDRPGEGLSWGSPDYEPPDRPSTNHHA